jgi:uncharacterized protein (DUF952 family)
MKKYVYKICYLYEWKKFEKKKIFYGSKKDIKDGYIHLSKKKQVKPTLKRYFLKKDKLVLLKIEVSKLKKLVWEKSTKEAIYPHLYSRLSIKNVKYIYKIIFKNNDYYFI